MPHTLAPECSQPAIDRKKKRGTRQGENSADYWDGSRYLYLRQVRMWDYAECSSKRLR